jgi:hypothetical protein
MRYSSLLAAMAVLFVPMRVDASPRLIPQPWPEPLGVVIRDAKTIHALEVTSADPKGISFKVTAALKGTAGEAPFLFTEILKHYRAYDGLFRVGDPVLCFRKGEIAILHIRGRWAYAFAPEHWRGEENWFCMADRWSTYRLDIIYEGSTAALRDHVVAILAGGERTITARPPYHSTERGRLWRIKASLKVTRFVESDESPHFVGWGNGDPKEVVLLGDALRADESRDRIAAAEELAHLGGEARPAIPALRRALGDDNPSVAQAVARALLLVDPEDRQGMETLVACLKNARTDVRANAATTLARAGLRARGALPELLRAVGDDDGEVRGAVASALGQLAPGTASEASALVALGALLKDGTDKGQPANAAVRALRQFGPSAWPVAQQVRQALSNLDRLHNGDSGEAVDLLARLSPPPIEFLAEVLTDPRSSYPARQAAKNHLVALGAQARRILPRLHRALADPPNNGVVEIGQALLAIDPEGTPTLIAPILLERLKKEASVAPFRVTDDSSVWLLGKCGPAARPALAAVLPLLQPGFSDTDRAVQCLIPLLRPEDRKLLPTLRGLLPDGDKHRNDPLVLAEILLRLGLVDEAVAQAATGLKSEFPGQWVVTAEWLGARGRQASSAEGALREALAKATGFPRARIALALWRAGGSGEGGPQDQALAALEAMWQRVWWREDDETEALVEVHSRVLAERDPTSALGRLLADRNPHLRLASAGVLARVNPGHPDIVEVLRALLARHPEFFYSAADTLIALGPRAQPLASFLMVRLRTENQHEYARVAGVLRRIDPGLIRKGWGAAAVPGAVPRDLDPLWDDLAEDDAFRADLAIWRLAGGGPRTVALVSERLRPPFTLTKEQLANLLADLNSDSFDTREKASSELARSLETTAPALRAARARNPPQEVRLRLDRLLELADAPETPEQRRRMRAVHLLTELDCPEAKALLDRLARDTRFDRELEATGRRPPARP